MGLMPLAALPSLFLHYFDTHFIEAATAGTNHDRVAREAEVATRLAVLAAETVYVPAASYVESPICRRIVDTYEALFPDGCIQLIGGDANLVAFAEAKLLQYHSQGAQYARYAVLLDGVDTAPPWFPRRRSATDDIRQGWLDTDLAALLGDLPRFDWNVDQAWGDTPDLLAEQEGSAFTPEYVRPLLFAGRPIEGPGLILARRIADTINDNYFESFASELGAGMLTELVFLSSRLNGNPRAKNLPYRTLRSALRERGAFDRVMSTAPEAVPALRSDDQVAGALVTAFGDAPPALPAQRLALRLNDAAPTLNAMRKMPSGQKGATAFHRAVGSVLETLFPYSLGPVTNEAPIDEGRKRVDIWLPNMATGGVMAWIRRSFGAAMITVEVKNYRDDIGNPEIDQLVGRFSPWHGQFGMVICRKVHNRDLAVARCRDVLHKTRGLVVVLDIDDLEAMSHSPHDPGLADLGEGLFGRRVGEVYL